jgi:hypothetical protein
MTKRTHLLIVGLLLMTTVAMSTTPASASAVNSSCFNSADHTGMGGTQISCSTAECGSRNELGVMITASDPDADVYADFNCGGQGAACGPMAVTCVGASPGLTARAESPGTCKGGTNEKWDSPVTIGCVSLGAPVNSEDDPVERVREAICTAKPDFPDCDPEDASPPGPGPGDAPEVPERPGVDVPRPSLQELHDTLAETEGPLRDAAIAACENASAKFGRLSEAEQNMMVPGIVNSGYVHQLTSILVRPDQPAVVAKLAFQLPGSINCEVLA